MFLSSAHSLDLDLDLDRCLSPEEYDFAENPSEASLYLLLRVSPGGGDAELRRPLARELRLLWRFGDADADRFVDIVEIESADSVERDLARFGD